MKLIISRTELVRALAAVKAAASPNANAPVLANVLLVANEKSLTLTGSDLDLFLRRKVDANVTDAASTTAVNKITVRAGLLHDIARAGDGEHVSLNLVRSTLHVECGTVKFQLNTIDAEEYPPMPRVKDATEFALTESALHSMLARTVFACGSNEERFVLNGSLIQLNGKLNVAACDGRRVGVVTVDSPSKEKLTLVVPAKAVRELLRLLNPSAEEDEKAPARQVQVSAAKNLVQFTFGDTILLTKLIEGDFPNFWKIVPQDDTPVASLARVDLLRSCERIALVADGVKLEFTKSSLTISSSRAAGAAKDVFGDASDSLLCAASKEATITLGTRYLREALNASSAEELQFFVAGNVAMLKSPTENWLAVIAGMTNEKPAAPVTKTETTKK